MKKRNLKKGLLDFQTFTVMELNQLKNLIGGTGYEDGGTHTNTRDGGNSTLKCIAQGPKIPFPSPSPSPMPSPDPEPKDTKTTN